MIIEWKQELATGNEAIDNQHKEILQKFNDFQSACNQGKARKELYNMFTFLNDYVKYHFAMEEELQVQHVYPDYEAHKEEHDGFIQSLKKLNEQLDTFGATPTMVILTNMALVNWLIKHISGTDKKFAVFLSKHLPMDHDAVPGEESQ